MNKKLVIIFVILIFLAVTGGVFWWQSGAELRELNKDLPEGIKITKDTSGQYKVTNKKDGYEIQWPEEISKAAYQEYWEGNEDPAIKAEDPIVRGGTIGFNGILISYIEFAPGTNLESWLQNVAQENHITLHIEKYKIGNIAVSKECIVKIRDKNVPLMCDDEYDYSYSFSVGSKNYKIMYASEKEAEDIIKNTNWNF